MAGGLLCLLLAPAQAGLGAWTPIGGVYGGTITSLVGDASGNLYAGSLGGYNGEGGGGLFKSSDGGLHWAEITTMPGRHADVFYVAIAPDGSIYASAVNGMFKSSDAGASWTPQSVYASGMVFDASGNIYAANGGGVYKSSDGGAHWRACNTGISVYATISSIAIAPDGSLYLGAGITTEYIGGIFISRNGCESWTALRGMPFDAVRSLLSDGAGNIYAGIGAYGVYKSSDGGKTWQASGLAGKGGVLALNMDGKGAIYAGVSSSVSGSGVYKSLDGGATWQATSEGHAINTIAIAPDGSLYAGANLGGIFRSSDGGQRWQAMNQGLPDSPVYAVTVDAAGNLYVGTQRGGVFKSRDAGQVWATANNGIYFIGDISALAAAADGSLYAGTPFAVYSSRDAGSLWARVNGGLGSYFTASALAIGSGKVYAWGMPGTGLPISGALFTSEDGGTTWTASGAAGVTINAAAIAASGAPYVGVDAQLAGNYVGGDGGTLATRLASGIPDSSSVTALAVAGDGGFYAGTDNRGVFSLRPGAKRWTALNTGLMGSEHISGLAVAGNGSVYATTLAGGIFQYTPPAMPFSLSASASGGNAALKLSAQLTVAPADVGRSGNLYVVAVLANGMVYQLSSQGWLAFSQMPLVPYATTTLGSHTLNVLSGTIDVSSLKGAVLYAGYGSDADDMLSNKKYAAFYVIP